MAKGNCFTQPKPTICLDQSTIDKICECVGGALGSTTLDVNVVNAADITSVIVDAIEAQTADLTAAIQEICDKLDAGITVNAVQSGEWVISIDNQPLSVELTAENIADLITALEAADLTVTIGGQDQVLDVNITNDPLNVAVDFQSLISALQEQRHVDFEQADWCIYLENGELHPTASGFNENTYDFFGNKISSTLVFSELVDGQWVGYTLQKGETTGRCKNTLLAEFKTDCCVRIPDANYDGAIAWVVGRPINGVWSLIDNRDPDNQVIVATGDSFNEFIANMEALGYTEWSFGETHYFCPCPPNLVNAGDYFVTVDGETVTQPECIPLSEIEGVPDKAVECGYALSTKDCNSDAILVELQTQSGLLSEIRDLLTCDEEEILCPSLVQGDANEFDGDGNPLPFPISFPFTTNPAQVQDFIIPFSVDDPNGCLAAADPATLIPVRFYFRGHDLVTNANGTTGFNIIIGNGSPTNAAYVTSSASNTFDNSGNVGDPDATVGVDLGQTLDVADRWLDFNIPLIELLNGTTMTTSAFGGVPAGITETLGDVLIYTPNVDWAALGCEGC